MILLIDNYDSFVHNLARYLRLLGEETHVVRNDRIDVAEIERLRPSAIVLSPGPGVPSQAGVCLALVRALYDQVPILGVCLGHQIIAEAFGGKVVRSDQPVHGRASLIRHDRSGVFRSLPETLLVGRYHSLIVERASVPDCLRVTAELEDGTVMAVQHQRFPVFGWQFHPESVLTQFGHELLKGFLSEINLVTAPSTSPPVAPPHHLTATPADFFQRSIKYPGK